MWRERLNNFFSKIVSCNPSIIYLYSTWVQANHDLGDENQKKTTTTKT